MNRFVVKRSRMLMASASVLVLSAYGPEANAQQTVVGGPGQALAAGEISTKRGSIMDGGVGGGVSVSNDAVASGVTIDNRSGGIGLLVYGFLDQNLVEVSLTGANKISSTTTAVMANGYGPITINTGNGSEFAGSQAAIAAFSGLSSRSDFITIENGANVLTGSTGISAENLSRAGGGIIINSIGGTISATNFGIAASPLTGPLIIGQGAGVTTAITTSGPSGVGIAGTHVSAVTTGPGGTIDGGETGIRIASGENTLAINISDAIGGKLVPTSRGISVERGRTVEINAWAKVNGGANGIYVAATDKITVGTASVSSTSSDAVYLSGQTGPIDYSLNGANVVQGATGVTINATSGTVAIRALDANSAIIGNTRAVDARTSAGGSVSINLAGTTTGGIVGSVTGGPGSVNINSAGVFASSDRAITATSTAGAINVVATGAISGGQGGISAFTDGPGSITISAVGAINGGIQSGIDSQNAGLGSARVGSETQRIGAVTAGTNGIFATAGGDVLVFTSSVNAGTRGIVAASQGAAPNGVVTVDTSGAINAASGFGVVAVNNGSLAANTLSVNATGPIVSTGGSGISAQTVGGDITIRSGAVTANSAVNGTWDGIFADGRGDSLVSVASTGAVSGTFRGIDVSSTGTTARSGVNIAAGGNVTAGNGQSAIFSAVNGLGSTTIGTATGATLNAVGGTGILANVATATGANNVTVNNLAAIGGAGTNRVVNGIVASISGAANIGNIAVNSSGGTIQASNAGILATTAGTGSINIGGTTGISSAITAPVVGISGSTTSGALTINTAAGGMISPGATVGIQAVTQTGAITINQAGSIGSAGAGNTVANGIYASIASGTSALNINSSGGIYITPGTGLQSAGIYAFNGGTGATNVVSSGVIDPGAYGVAVQGAGSVSYVANGGLVEGDQGVYVASTGAGPVTVTSLAGTTVRGLNGVGLQAVSVGGPVNVVSGGTVTGTTSGIVATTSGSGSITVTNTGAVTSGSGPSISAQSGTGGLTLNVRGNVVSASGPAIVANSTGGGTINVASGAVVAGRVDSPTGSVIALNTASGTTSTINVAQGATVQAVSGSPFTTAIRATGGSVVVNNSGTISGQIDFSALTSADTGQLTGGAGTTFQTGGLSVFAAGNDVFTNAGQLVTVGTTTTFDFRGGTNVFTNNGQVFVGFSPVSAAGSGFLLSSLTTFNNAGSLNLMNGVLGDSIVAPGTNYVGSTGARLMLDTAIIPGGRSDFLTVGTSSGVTSVVIRDPNPMSFGAYNPTGIVVVNGATRAGDFVLDNGSSFYNAGIFGGAIDKPGLFFSQLGVNGAGQTVLVSLPKVQAYQFSTLASQAQAVWYETAPNSARQAEVRDQLASGKGAGGFWVDVEGTHTARDVDRKSLTLAGIKSYDASYGQDVTSATIGYDAVRPMMDGDVVFGASVGYVNSSADFDKQSTSVDMDGISGAAYASFVRSGWFVAGTVGVTQLNAEIKAARLTGFTQQETDISSVGATLDAGFRAPFIMGTTIEPTAALAYVNTSVDDFVAAGSTFRFEDGESLRPSIGARVSGDANFGASWATRYNVSVRAVGEALSENSISVGSAAPNLRVVDQFENAYGEVKAGLTSESANGWSVFGDVTGRYSDQVRAIGASIGMRLRY